MLQEQTDQTQELLGQLTRTDQFRTSLAELLQQVLLLLVQIRRSPEQQPAERARARGAGHGLGVAARPCASGVDAS